MSLRTNYRDWEADASGKRYTITDLGGGHVRIDDVTNYATEGDTFGAGDINATNAAVNGKADLVSGKVDASQTSAAIVEVSASRTLSAGDAGKLLLCKNANITITAPSNLAIGTEIEVCRWGTQTVSFSQSGVCSANGYSIANQYGVAVLKKITATEWLLVGDLE